jgi:hypothetical protein
VAVSFFKVITAPGCCGGPPLWKPTRFSSTPDQVGTRAASELMRPTGWAEPWNRLGDWQASSKSSSAKKSSNLITYILHRVERRPSPMPHAWA